MSKKSGITLIEVLVVVVILGVLAMVIIPQIISPEDISKEYEPTTEERIVVPDEYFFPNNRSYRLEFVKSGKSGSKSIQIRRLYNGGYISFPAKEGDTFKFVAGGVLEILEIEIEPPSTKVKVTY